MYRRERVTELWTKGPRLCPVTYAVLAPLDETHVYGSSVRSLRSKKSHPFPLHHNMLVGETRFVKETLPLTTYRVSRRVPYPRVSVGTFSSP